MADLAAAALGQLSVDDTNTTNNGGVALTSASGATYPKILTLDIGGRKFKVSRDILEAESGLFKLQLSGRFTWEPEGDGTYFIDADADLFEHLLRFMRRPNIFPLFYDRVKSFDYDLYNRLQVEAEYFQVDALCEWIKAKRYLQAVKIKTGSPFTRNINQMLPAIYTGNKYEDRYIVAQTRKVYLCPRQIMAHRGHPEFCGGACHRRQAENDVVYDDETYLQVVSVEKEILFDEKVCRAE